MRFYTQQHQYYCGVDLHARSLYLCVLHQAGEVRLHRNGPPHPVLESYVDLPAEAL